MKNLLIDTGAFYAQRDRGDERHHQAVGGFAKLANSSAKLFSSEHILDETITLLARRESYGYAVEAGKELFSSRVICWLHATKADWNIALKLMSKLADQSVSFTDCISFALMKREGIETVFGFDRHFRSAGFDLWPGYE